MKHSCKNNLLALLLCAVLLLGVLPLGAQAAEENPAGPENVRPGNGTAATITDSGELDGGLTWALNSDAQLLISGTGAMPDWAKYTDAPWYGKGVRSVVIGEGVTNVGNRAFQEATLITRLSLPSTVKVIGIAAFSGCTGLTLVTLPDSITEIKDSAFSGCTGLVDIKLPAGLTELGVSVFNGCKALKMITLPAGLETIPQSTFEQCEQLADVAIPSSVTAINQYAFSSTILCDVYYGGTEEQWNEIMVEKGNDQLSSVRRHYSADLEYVPYRQYATYGICGRYLTWNLDEDGKLTVSGTGAMWDWREHTSATFSLDRITLDMPWYAKRDLIRSVVIDDGVTSIGLGAFSGMPNLTEVSIPSTVKTIGRCAFSHSTRLTGITIPYGVTCLSGYAFYDSGITNIELPESINYRGMGDNNIFWGCTSLKRAVLPSSLDTIPQYTFGNCTALEEVTIPVSIVRIGYYAFDKCTSLSDVYYGGTEEQWQKVLLQTASNNKPLFSETLTVHYTAAVPVTGVTLDRTSLSLVKGESETLTAAVAPADATYQNIMWSSSKTSVAAVANGTVTGVGIGVATVTVKTADGGWEASCMVVVTDPEAGPDTGLPIELAASCSKADRTVTVSVVTAEAVTLSNFDVTLQWEGGLFTLKSIANGQPALLTNFQTNLNTGAIAAASSGEDVTIPAGETVAVYTLSAKSALPAGSYAFFLAVEDASDAEANALSWKGKTIAGTLPVFDLAEESFDLRGGSVCTLDFAAPAAGDFTVACEEACVVLCSDGTDYHKLTGTLLDGGAYAFTLPADYSGAEKIIVAVRGDFSGNGEVNSTDALQVLRCAAGNRTFGPEDVLICDINGDGRLTSTDALQLLRVCVDLLTLTW